MEKLRSEGMDAILLKIREIEKLFSDATSNPDLCVVHRNSAVGKFLRKIVLAVNSLDFTSQFQFAQRVGNFVNDDANEKLAEFTSEQSSHHMTLDDVSMAIDSAEVKAIEGTSDLEESLCQLYGKDKARTFLRQQGQKLRDNPVACLPPKELQRELVQILKSNPDMAEVFYLSFMNHLTFGEYVSAIEDCHKHFLLKRDIAGKKFRYALLNLAITHRRFGHMKQAELALKECIDLSQQASDKECLQHALAWLCRTNQDMSCYIRTSIVQSYQQQLWSLYSLGLQTLSRLGAMSGCTPSACIDGLYGKCPKQLDAPEAQVNLAISLAILWIGFGFHQNAKLQCEAILHLSQTQVTSSHRDWIVVNENTMLALVFIAHYAVLDYDYATADRLIEVARQVVPEYHELRYFVELASLCNTCERALHRDSIEECEAAVASLALFSTSDAQLYHVRLLQQTANYEQAIKLVNSLQSEQDSSGAYCNLVSRLLQARILIDAGGDNAIQLILRGLAVCDRFHLRYLEAMFKLELVRAQARAGFSNSLLRGTINSVTPMILSHGSKEDKLLLRSIQAEVTDGVESVDMMDECYKEWKTLGDIYKAKRALQWLAKRCHELAEVKRRNEYSKLFRQLVTQQQRQQQQQQPS